MGLRLGINDVVGLIVGQTRGFFEVVRLKLRIIGFSNKRSGLMTRLGELTFKAVEAGLPVADDPVAVKLVDDIREADREIGEAERDINRKKEDGKDDMRGFQEKHRKKIVSETNKAIEQPETNKAIEELEKQDANVGN